MSEPVTQAAIDADEAAARQERRNAAMESYARAQGAKGIIEVTDIILMAVQTQFDAIRCGVIANILIERGIITEASFDELVTAEWEKIAAELPEDEDKPRLQVAKSLNGLKGPRQQ